MILIIKNDVGGFSKSVRQNYSPGIFLHSDLADVAKISFMFPKIHWVSRVESPHTLSNRIQSKPSVSAEV